MGGPQNWFGRGGDEKISIPFLESNPDYPVHSLVTMLTELPPLLQKEIGRQKFFSGLLLRRNIIKWI
jgi:hypothetical protein